MSSVVLWAVLLAGVVALTPLADRLRVPLPVLLTVFGLLVPLVPIVPRLTITPSVILPVVLPPLLFTATQRSTANEFRQDARPILLLAVGLTVASAGAVAVTARLAGFDWPAAAVLGAVVAPPDPVAATAVARRLRLPGRLVTVLEGEGMFNDATALVLYALAVAAVVTGGVSIGDIGGGFVLAVVGGIAIGLVAGVLSRFALAALHDAAAETTVTVAVPFVAYLVAEELHGSGVLAVLTVGLFLRTYAHTAVTSAGWLLGRAVWRYADYLITSLVFVLIGFELTEVLEGSHVSARTVQLAMVVVVVLVAVRFGWMFPAAALARLRRGRRRTASPYGPRETVVADWAGMRGVVTVATALALPTVTDAGSPFPVRGEIVVVALVTVLVTLVVQGLTLAPLVTVLGVGSGSYLPGEVAELRRRATEAALEAARVVDPTEPVPPSVREAVTLQYEGYLAAQTALGGARAVSDDSADYRGELQRLLRRASEAERSVVLQARRHGEVSAEVADIVRQDVEARAVRDLT